jgi:hypothetical protein
LPGEHFDELFLAVPGHAESSTPRKTGTPMSSRASSIRTSSTGFPGGALLRSIETLGGSEPTIISAIFAGVRSATRPPPTTTPRRSTVTTSANPITSRNLCVIMSTLMMPSDAIFRSKPRTSSASPGVRTLVGSSRITMRLPR